jgi:hypothetical protein
MSNPVHPHHDPRPQPAIDPVELPDHKNESGSNSGHAVNMATLTGKRHTGVDDAVDWIRQYPGIDGFTTAWLHAGGRVTVVRGEYHFVGLTRQLDVQTLAQVMKLQVRLQEAAARGRIETTKRLIVRKTSGFNKQNQRVVRKVASIGYKVAGSPEPDLSRYGKTLKQNQGAVNTTANHTDDVIASKDESFDEIMRMLEG